MGGADAGVLGRLPVLPSQRADPVLAEVGLLGEAAMKEVSDGKCWKKVWVSLVEADECVVPLPAPVGAVVGAAAVRHLGRSHEWKEMS